MQEEEAVVNNRVSIVATQEDLSESLVKQIEKQVELRSRMLKAFVKATYVHDWIDFGGKPYLEGEGAMRIAAVAGLGVRTLHLEKEALEGGHYKFIATVEVSGGNRNPVTDEGDCASNDRFFQRKGASPPASEVNSSDIRKKAVENARTRAVCSFLGIKGLSWENLAEYGLTSDKAGASVSFKSSKAQDSSPPSQASGAVPGSMDIDHSSAWSEILDILEHVKPLGVSESQYWKAITRSEKDGKVYEKDSQESAYSFIRTGIEKYGKSKLLFDWLAVARDKMARIEDKEPKS